MNGCARIAVVSLLLAGVAACGKVQAHTPVPDPALVTPAPPPRVIVPATITIPEPEPPASPARPAQTPVRPPERPAPQTPPTSSTATSPTQPPTETAPPPVLQTASNVGDLELKTRQVLTKANADLGRIDPRSLGPDARAQYDTARGFIRRAEAALRDKNLVYARELADKAAALAGLIVKH